MSAPFVASAPSTEARLRELLSATAPLITEVSLDGVLRRVVRVAAQVIGARYAAIGVLGPDGTTLEHFTAHGIDTEAEQRIGSPPRGHGILGLVTREARPIRLRDLTKHPEFHGFPPHHAPMQSFLGVPILGNRGAVGSLYLAEKTGGEAFSEEDEDIATLLAAKTALAASRAALPGYSEESSTRSPFPERAAASSSRCPPPDHEEIFTSISDHAQRHGIELGQ